jgi:uncharacterized protein
MIRLFWPALVTLLCSILVFVPQQAVRAAQLVPLVIATANGHDRVFQVEVAATPDQRERGLMQRQAMALNAGMLFVFDRDAPVAFWMKNTLISLDMLFIRSDGTIAHIHERAKPLDETAIPSRGSIRYVLEINGGLARTLGIRPGDQVTLPPGIGPS